MPGLQSTEVQRTEMTGEDKGTPFTTQTDTRPDRAREQTYRKSGILAYYANVFSMRSCSQTRPGICSQTRPGISLCSLSGLSLPGRGQFLVLLNQSEQDREPLSALALDSLCQTGLTPWSVSLPFHRTILLFLFLCKILFPGPVGALLISTYFDLY